MSNGVVEALDQAVVRLGKSMGKDAGKAVEKLYRTTTGKLKKAIESSIETDAERAKDLKTVLADMEKNAARNTVGDAEKDAQKKAHAALRSKLKQILNPKYPYRRPSGFRDGVRDKVWEAAKGPDGKVLDPLTGKEMSKDEPWDMGHRPGYEFRKHRDSAFQRGISREQFLDEHNNPDHYRPELPASNSCHDGEDKTDTYEGL